MEEQEPQAHALLQTSSRINLLEAIGVLNTLKEWGFKLNDYDQCVMNITINR